jgi:hypothetical protein
MTKTLYDRLKPEYRKAISKNEKKYPFITSSLVEVLKSNYFWNDLTISQAKDVISFTDQTFGSISYYDWSYGDKFLVPNDKS